MGTVRALKCYQVDAFTSKPFGGNPAAVVLLPRAALPLGDASRQRIAAEFNLSETAFLECADDAPDDFAACPRFHLRWFTPAIEVPLCGHATLAAAAALFFGEGHPVPALAFDTLSGELVVTRRTAAAGAPEADLLSMDLPLIEATAAAVPPGMDAVVQVGPPHAPAARAASGLGPNRHAGARLKSQPSCPADALSVLRGARQAAVGGAAVEEVRYDPRLRYLLVVLRDGGAAVHDAFLGLQPNSQQLGDAHGGGQLVGVIVTVAADGGGHDFFSRFFAPWAGIAEDPVTGSAHSILGSYWAQRLGKRHLKARQCSARGGELTLDVDEAAGRVVVAGQAVTVLEGRLLLPEEAAAPAAA